MLAVVPPSVVSGAIWVVLVAGLVALVLIALRALKIAVPGWFVEACWAVAIVVVIVLAIKLVASIA